MRKHKKEIERFANTEYGTKVWTKYKDGAWTTTSFPSWHETHNYIIADEFAELRMESERTGRPIQLRNKTGEWKTPPYDLAFTLPLENYRLKPKEEEFKYPIYKKDNGMEFVVKFTDLTVGEIVVAKPNSFTRVGYIGEGWSPHTNTHVWEDYDYVEPKEDKFKYPIYKRSKIYGYTIEFTGEQKGVIIADTEKSKGADYIIGLKSDDWVKHTNINTWEDCDYKEPTYYYKWEKLQTNDLILTSNLVTDKYAEKHNFKAEGWVKIESSKRTWDN